MTQKEKAENKSLVDKILDVDPRILWALLFIALIAPIVSPIGLPVAVTSYTQDLYNYLDDLPTGSKVLMWGEQSFGYWPTEYRPGTVAFVQHMIDKGLKIIVMSGGSDDSLIWDTVFKELVDLKGYRYGIDYVQLGFYPGGEAAMSSFASNVRALVRQDYFGTPIEQLSIMNDVNNAKAFSLAIYLTGTPAGVFLRQFHTTYDITVGLINISGMISDSLPYYHADQVVGFINGLRGGAEYEILINRPRWGAASVDSLSTSHILYAVLVIFANILYLVQRRNKR